MGIYIYIVGYTYSSTNIATSGSHQTELNGTSDGFILALDSNYVVLWSTYFGGESSDVIYGVSSLSDNSLVITGLTQSLTGISSDGALQESFAGEWDSFIARFNAEGELMWSTYYGGILGDKGESIVSNDNDDIFVGGETFSQGLATEGVHQDSLIGETREGLLLKLNSSGELLWCTYYGGIEGDRIVDLDLNSEDEILIFGETNSEEYISTIGTYQEQLAVSPSSNYDSFIAKMDDTGNRVWGTYYGGEAFDHAFSIRVDINNNVIVCGHTGSDSNIVSIGAHKVQNQLTDAYLASFTTDGDMNWGTYFGGEKSDFGTVVVTVFGTDIFIVGQTLSDSSITLGNPFKQFSSIPDVTDYFLFPDLYVVKFNSDGVQQWGTYYGDVEKDRVQNLIMFNENSLALVGSTESTENMITDDAFQSEIMGDNSTLFAVFDIDIEVGINEMIIGSASIYPNPSSDLFYLNIESNFEEGDIKITALDGKIVKEIDSYIPNSPIHFNFTPGMYIVSFLQEDKLYIAKLIVE